MTIFTQIKENISVPQAAERYGLQPNRSRMCRCPFHADQSPSMKLNDTYFYCFGCQESGDVIALCAKLFDLSPMEAARRLADDFGIRIDEPTYPKGKPPGRGSGTAKPSENPRKREGHCLFVLIEYERFLKAQIEQYAPKSTEAEWDERFCAASQRLPQVSQTIDDLFSPDAELRTQTAARLTNDGTIARIEQFLKKANENTERAQNGSAATSHAQDDDPQSDPESAAAPRPVSPHLIEQNGKEVLAHGDDRDESDRPTAA